MLMGSRVWFTLLDFARSWVHRFGFLFVFFFTPLEHHSCCGDGGDIQTKDVIHPSSKLTPVNKCYDGSPALPGQIGANNCGSHCSEWPLSTLSSHMFFPWAMEPPRSKLSGSFYCGITSGAATHAVRLQLVDASAFIIIKKRIEQRASHPFTRCKPRSRP